MDVNKVVAWLNTAADHMENKQFRMVMREAARIMQSQKLSLDAVIKANRTMAEKLNEFLTAEQEGRLLKLPCAIGTKVYQISWCDEMVDGERCPYQCNSTQRDHVFKTDCIKFCGIDECKFSLRMLDWIGKTVFLTREEAQKKLEEKANGKTDEG